jgi:hypothetical protein
MAVAERDRDALVSDDVDRRRLVSLVHHSSVPRRRSVCRSDVPSSDAEALASSDLRSPSERPMISFMI